MTCTFLGGVALLGLLQIIPAAFRKNVIAFVTFLGGAFYAVEFFLPKHHNLLSLHMRTLVRAREGWVFSAVLVGSFIAMLAWGLLNAYAPYKVLVPKVPGLSAPITNGDIYDVLFYGGYANLDAAMFALIGFFIISASYRAFRIKSVEASLMMTSAVIVMLGQVTLGTAITSGLPTVGPWANFRLENMALYILNNINTPAMRGIYFGIGVGFLATSLRLWLSLERGVYFDAEL
jgi:hypothetical protein